MSTSETTGRIVAIERLRNSASGNPRFRITLQTSSSMGTWNTAADHAFNYEVGNPGFRAESHVSVAIGGRGTIVGMAPAACSYTGCRGHYLALELTSPVFCADHADLAEFFGGAR